MVKREKNLNQEIISLRLPSKFNEIIEKVPKPKEAIPTFGLPKWKLLSLESKIPMVPCPEGSYDLARQKLGKKLQKVLIDPEFNLSDPYNHETEFSYNSLHDEHLAPFFQRENNVKHLIKCGFVTQNLYVKCSLRDYNNYRNYLKKLHDDRVRKELKRQEYLNQQYRRLQFTENMALKETQKIMEREKLRNKLNIDLMVQKKHEKEEWIQKVKNNMRKKDEQIRAHEIRKQEAALLRRMKRAEKVNELEKKLAFAQDIRRRTIIKTVVEWKRKDRKRSKIRHEKRLEEIEQKLRRINERWDRKREFQRQKIEREQLLLQYVAQKRLQSINEYNEKIGAERERMKRLFRKIQRFTNCYKARYISARQTLTCCDIKKEKKVYDGGKNSSNPDFFKSKNSSETNKIIQPKLISEVHKRGKKKNEKREKKLANVKEGEHETYKEVEVKSTAHEKPKKVREEKTIDIEELRK